MENSRHPALIEQLWQRASASTFRFFILWQRLLFLLSSAGIALVTNQPLGFGATAMCATYYRWQKLDIAGNAVDARLRRNRQRLGIGGRIFMTVRCKTGSSMNQPVGYAHDCQLVEKLPVEEWGYPRCLRW